jgi:ribonuclease Z
MIKINFLGTSGATPTKDRNHPCNLVRYENEQILVDCGENTQRQLKIADLPATKLTRILISHIHGDHIFGLPGLIQSLKLHQYSKTLEIYGPAGIKKLVNGILDVFTMKGNSFKIIVHEIKKPGVFLDLKKLKMEASFLNHGVKCLAYSIKEKDRRKIDVKKVKKLNLPHGPLIGRLQKGKDITYKGKKVIAKNMTTLIPGKKITFIADTSYTESAVKIAKASDILVSESTYTNDHKDKAKEHNHLTAEEAAKIAKKSKSKKLILTHFSQRYKTTTPLLNEARKTFPNTIAAKDFMEITI